MQVKRIPAPADKIWEKEPPYPHEKRNFSKRRPFHEEKQEGRRGSDPGLSQPWKQLLAGKRRLIQKELAYLALQQNAPCPRRLSIAMYSLGELNRLLRSEYSEKALDMVPFLGMLNDNYFSKTTSYAVIIEAYHAMADDLTAKLPKGMNFFTLDPSGAINKYKPHAMKRLKELAAYLEGGAARRIDVKA